MNTIDPAKFYSESRYSIGAERIGAAILPSSPLKGTASRLSSLVLGLLEFIPGLGSLVFQWDKNNEEKKFTLLDTEARKEYVDTKTTLSETTVKINNMFYRESSVSNLFQSSIKTLTLQKLTDGQGNTSIQVQDSSKNEFGSTNSTSSLSSRDQLKAYISQLESLLGTQEAEVLDWLKKEAKNFTSSKKKEPKSTRNKEERKAETPPNSKIEQNSPYKPKTEMTSQCRQAIANLKQAPDLKKLRDAFRRNALLLHPDKRKNVSKKIAESEYKKFNGVYQNRTDRFKNKFYTF